MKISNGVKQDYNYKNTYKLIYKQIKEEIKNKVINRFINQIDYYCKIVEQLKKENLLLKNDLIYILKRVLLSKNDTSNKNLNNQNLNTQRIFQQNDIYSYALSNTSFLNNKSYNSLFTPGETINNETNNINYNHKYKLKNINNSIVKSPTEKRRYSIDDEYRKGNSSLSPLETSRQMNVNNKINYYLNSLYKHNFSEECIAGTASIHLLNKNQSIYDELFVNKNRSKNKVIQQLNTDINYTKIVNNKAKTNSKKKAIYLIEGNFNTTRNRKNIEQKYKPQKNKTNGLLRVHKKVDTNITKENIGKINKKNNYENKSSINIDENLYFKKSRLNGGNNGHRSKFLVNKF